MKKFKHRKSKAVALPSRPCWGLAFRSPCVLQTIPPHRSPGVSLNFLVAVLKTGEIDFNTLYLSQGT